MSKPYILCVDDQPMVLDTLVQQIGSHLEERFLIERAESGQEALELATEIHEQKGEIAVVVSDQMMPQMKGHEMLIAMHNFSPNTMKILLTGMSTTEELGRAINEAKLYRYLTKPWEKLDLQLTVEEAAKTFMQQQELDQYTHSLEALVHASREMASQESLMNLAQVILKFLAMGSGCDCGGIIIYDKSDTVLQLFYRRESSGIVYDQDRADLPVNLIDSARICDQEIVIPVASKSMLLDQAYVARNKIRTVYAKGLYYKEQCTAVIFLEGTKANSNFNLNRIRYIEVLSYDATITIEKMKLIHGMERTIVARTQEVNKQSEIIQQRTQDLEESLHFASRLQANLLQPTDTIRHYFPEAFILFQPKDYVSGDFYWIDHADGKILFAIVDCVGHGIPGGMLSIMGLSLLKNIFQSGITDPAQILTEMNTIIHKRNSGDDKNSQYAESMDIALCAYDVKTKSMEFAGAHRSLYHLHDGILDEIKGDSCSIGGNALMQMPNYRFSSHHIQLAQDDVVFAFSDGLTDQFGGPSNQKFSIKRLREWLLQQDYADMTKVYQAICQELNKWKMNNTQTDDISFIAINFTQVAKWDALPGGLDKIKEELEQLSHIGQVEHSPISMLL